jgi:hypothetical protein
VHYALHTTLRRAERAHGVFDAAALILRGAQHLANLDPPVAIDRDEIREGSADIDADGGTHHAARRRRTM